MKEKVIKKVNFNKGGAGNYVPRIVLNTEWVSDMGITKDNNEIEMSYNKKKKEISIKKK